jgi:hypothetical protein
MLRLRGRAMRVVLGAANLALAIFLLTPSQVVAKNCFEDTLRKNADGEILITMSGMVFETLPGESFEAMLWLPVTELLICSETMVYEGKSYEVYEIINVDDGEKASAMRIK